MCDLILDLCAEMFPYNMYYQLILRLVSKYRLQYFNKYAVGRWRKWVINDVCDKLEISPSVFDYVSLLGWHWLQYVYGGVDSLVNYILLMTMNIEDIKQLCIDFKCLSPIKSRDILSLYYTTGNYSTTILLTDIDFSYVRPESRNKINNYSISLNTDMLITKKIFISAEHVTAVINRMKMCKKIETVESFFEIAIEPIHNFDSLGIECTIDIDIFDIIGAAKLANPELFYEDNPPF